MSDLEPEHWYWRDGAVAPGPCVIFDVDGVLSDASHRQHFLEGPGMYWDSFFEACDGDPLIAEMAALGRLLQPHVPIVLLTARPLRVQRKTLGWLERHADALRWDLLVMRPEFEWAAARTFKAGALRELAAYGFDAQLAFEDDPRNVEMFRAAGVPTVYIHSGYYV